MKRSPFLLDRLILCASLLDKSVHCEFVDMSRCGSCSSVNCKLCSGFLKAFYLEVLPGTHVTTSLVSVSFFRNKLSAEMHFLIALSLGKTRNPGLLGCNNIDVQHGHDKRGRLLIASSVHRFSFWYWIHTQRYMCMWFHEMWKVLQWDTASLHAFSKALHDVLHLPKALLLNVFIYGKLSWTLQQVEFFPGLLFPDFYLVYTLIARKWNA